MWVRPRQAPSDEIQVFYLGARAAVSHAGSVLGGRYELLEVLGCGGTAAVYRALDLKTKAAVAVKVLHAGARETIGAFFQQEGRLTARICSPHLVRAHDFGEDDGRLFIVFDVVPGESLASMFYGQVMPWRELCQVVLQVLDALAALHRLGIVHRDVKPDNVYVARKLGDEPHATLLDLGFALVPPERRLTNAPEPSRIVFGTEGYIAPELLGGCPPEPRNDLYSVGALMYVMLTAQPVPALGACPEALVIPSPRAFLPTIPPAIDAVVMRALSDVEDRFQNAAEMAAAIRAAMLDAEAKVADLPVASVSAGVAGPMMAELPAAAVAAGPPEGASVSAGAAGPAVAELPAAVVRANGAGSAAEGVPAGVLGPTAAALPAAPAPIVDRSAVSPAAAAATHSPAGRRHSGTRLAAACLAAGLVGAGAMYVALITAPESAPWSGAPPTACVGASGNEPAAPLVAAVETERVTPRTQGDADGEPGAQDVPASQPAANGTGAIPARLASPSSDATTRSRRPRNEPTFEQAMARLVPRARACAQKAGIAETPRAVLVRGDTETGQVQSVRVVDMSLEHPFAGCIAEVIREAEPPLRAKNHSFTFFSGGPR